MDWAENENYRNSSGHLQLHNKTMWHVPVYTSVFFYIFVFILQLEGMSIFICLSKTGLNSEYFVIKSFDNFWRKKCCPQGRRGEILYTGSCFSPDPSAMIGCQVATLSNHHHIIKGSLLWHFKRKEKKSSSGFLVSSVKYF